jgi:hypothetical protein
MKEHTVMQRPTRVYLINLYISECMQMDANAQHSVMARQAAGMVAVMVCFVVSRLRRISGHEIIPYGSRTHAQRHRQSTLQMMYNYNDTEYVAMLRLRRVLFFFFMQSS